MKKHAALIAGACVAVIAFTLYLPSLGNQFLIWDDDLNVYENRHIRSLDRQFLLWALTDMSSGNWQPLTWISHALTYSIWQLDPAGHHLTNVALHALNAFLVVWLTAALLDVPRSGRQGPDASADVRPGDNMAVPVAAGTAGLLFACHPVHVESVSWISGRTDLLFTLFYLPSIIAYLAAVRSGQHAGHAGAVPMNRWYLCSFMLFSLAASSKPMAITLPAVLLLIDWHPLGRMNSWRDAGKRLLEKVPFFALSAAVALLTVLAETSLGAITGYDRITFATRMLVAGKALSAYVMNMLWPRHLSPLYPYPADPSLLSTEYAAAIALVAGIMIGSILLARKHKVLLLGWAFFVITLLPVLGLIKARPVFMADRYAYLPSVGLGLIAGFFSARLWSSIDQAGSRLSRTGIAAMGVLLMSALCTLTVLQNAVWKDSLTLWNHVIDREGVRSAVAYNNRGSYYGEQGNYDRAIDDFLMAIRLDPAGPSAYVNLAVALESKGLFNDALQYYDSAVQINAADHMIYYNRGLLYNKLGRGDRAVEDLTRAVGLQPGFIPARLSRADIYRSMGQPDRAQTDYRAACALGSAEACAQAARYEAP